MEKIMIDLDDVITSGGYLHYVNEFLGTSYKEDDIKTYYLQDLVEDLEGFKKFIRTKNIYDKCKLKENAYEVLKELNEKYELFIATAYIWRDMPEESGYVLEQKFNYLKDTLPFISPYQYIFISDKSVLNTNIKIDDKVNNLKNADTILLFRAYHNKEITKEKLKQDNIIRVDNWEGVRKILL